MKNKLIFFGDKKKWTDTIELESLMNTRIAKKQKQKKNNKVDLENKLLETLQLVSYDDSQFRKNSFIFPVEI